jgi:hypothetical protein
MDDPDDTFEIEVEVVRVGKAATCMLTEYGDEVWVPHSQILAGSDVENLGDEGTLVVPRWLARKEGWL